MFTLNPGWTIERMKQVIRERNNGEKCSRRLKDGRSYYYVYRQGDNHCAVGAFLPDDLCDRLEADKHVGSVSITGRYECGPLGVYTAEAEQHMPLSWLGMDTLQNIHDFSDGSENIHDLLFAWIDDNVVEA